jgi:tripartite-type tricarboxylate transporter receptor subunit TctC
MRLLRRYAASIALLFSGLMSLSAPAQAQSFPAHPIYLIIPQGPGTGADVVGRMLGAKMGQALGQPVIIENRAGANGIMASTDVMRAPADGYTLLLTSVSLVSFNPALYKNTPYDPFKDFTFVGPVADASFVLVASRKQGINSWDDLVKRAKSEPGGLKFASGGVGNSTHLYAEMVSRQTHLRMQHIPYKTSSQALLSVVTGETDFMVSPTVVALPQLKSGTLTVLAQSGTERAPQLSDVPLVSELIPGMPALPGWYALVGPAKLPPAIVAQLEQALHGFLADPATRTTLLNQFLFPMQGDSNDIRKRAQDEAKLWGGLIKDLKITLD